jgi:hypothetical protein
MRAGTKATSRAPTISPTSTTWEDRAANHTDNCACLRINRLWELHRWNHNMPTPPRSSPALTRS